MELVRLPKITVREEDIERQEQEYADRVEAKEKEDFNKNYKNWQNIQYKKTGKVPFLTEKEKIFPADFEEYSLFEEYDLFKKQFLFDKKPSILSRLEYAPKNLEHKEWRKYLYEKRKKKFKSLDPVSKAVYFERRPYLALEAFGKQAVENYTFGFIKANDPVYGRDYLEHFKKSSMAGSLFGEIANFATLSALAGTAGIPAKLQKIAKGSKQARMAFESIGSLQFQLGKINKTIPFLKAFAKGAAKEAAWKYGTKLEAGIATSLTMAIRGFKGTLETSVKEFRKEDRMTKAEWEKNLPAPIHIFLKGIESAGAGWGISLINAPEAWTWRVAGDALYSTSQQFQDIAIGRKDKFEWEQFWYDFALGHVIGELQGKFLSPPKDLQMFGKQFKIIQEETKTILKDTPTTEAHKNQLASAMWMANIDNYKNTGKQLNVLQRKKSMEALIPLLDDPTSYKIIYSTETKNVIDIKTGPRVKARDMAKEKSYKYLKDLLELNNFEIANAKTLKVALDPKIFETYLKSIGKNIVKEKVVFKRELLPEPISEETFRNELNVIFKDTLPGKTYNEVFPLRKVSIAKQKKREMSKVDFPDVVSEEFKVANLVKEKLIDLAYHDDILVLQGVKDTSLVHETINRMADALGKKPLEYFQQRIKNKKQLLHDLRVMDFKETKSVKWMNTILNSFRKNVIASIFRDVKRNVLKIERPLTTTSKMGEEYTATDRLDAKQWEQKQAIERQSLGMTEQKQDDNASLYTAILSLIKSKNKVHIKSGIAYYLRDVLKYEPTEIKAHMDSIGIPIKDGSRRASYGRKLIVKIFEKAEVKTKIINKGEYTKKEIAELWLRMNNKRKNTNPVTGLKSDVGTYTRELVKTNGGVVLDTKIERNQVLNKHGEVAANNYLNVMSKVMQEHIDKFNRYFAKIKTKKKVFIKNPLDDNSTKFIVYHTGLEKAQFDNFISSLQKKLVSKFSEQSFDENIAVIIGRKGEKVDVITNFKNITFSKIKNLDEFLSTSSTANTIKRVGNYFNEEVSGLAARLSKTYFDLEENPFPELRDISDLNIYFKENPSARKEVKRKIIEIADIVKSFGPGKMPEEYAEERLKENMNMARSTEGNKEKFMNRIANQGVDFDEKIGQHVDNERDGETEGFATLLQKTGTELNRERIKTALTIKARYENAKSKIGRAWARTRELYRSAGEFWGVLQNISHKIEDSLWGRESEDAIKYFAGAKEYLSAVEAKYIMLPCFEQINFQNTEQYNKFNKMIEWARQEEFSTLIDPKTLEARVSYRTLAEPIKGDVKDVASLLKSSKEINDKVLLNISKKSNDPLLFHKIMVQHLGINPRQLIAYQVMAQKIYYDAIEQERIKGTPAVFRAYSMEQFLKRNLEKELYNKLKPEFLEEGWTEDIWERKPSDMKTKLKAMIEKRYEGLDKQIEVLNYYVDTYYRTDLNNLSYIHHVVLSDPRNQRKFANQVAKKIAGKTVRGEKTLNPIMEEFAGRKVATLKDLVELGFEVELNAYKNMRESFVYLKEKNMNLRLATNLKSSFLDKFEMYTKLYLEEKQRLRTQGRNEYEATKVYDRLFEESGGYVYIPTNDEVWHVKNQITKINELMVKTKNTGKLEDLRGSRLNLIDKYKKMTGLLKVLSGDFLITKKVKDKAMQSKQIEQAVMFTDSVLIKVFGEDSYLPMNKESFEKETDVKKLGETKNKLWKRIQKMYTNIRTYEKKGKIHAPNVPLWEGLYFHQSLQRLFKQYLFRHDIIHEKSPYEAVEVAIKVYDKVNHFMKVMTLIKPMIMLINDPQQAFKASWRWMQHIPYAVHAWKNKFNKDSKYHKEYWAYNSKGLFNNPVAPESLVNDSSRGYFEVIGKNPLIGKYCEELNKVSPTTEILPKVMENFFKKVWITTKYAFKIQQEATWAIDEIIRTATAKTMLGVYERGLGPGKADEALSKACNWTNMFLVQYSRLPSRTRQIANRLAVFPTYRHGNLRAEIESWTKFGKNTLRILTGFSKDKIAGMKLTDPRYKAYYDSNMKQALFEMGPFVRAFGMNAAIKGLMALFFGYSYEGIYDFLTGYRAKKFDEKEDTLDRDIRYLSLGGPVFELAKLWKRPLLVTLQYNSARLLGLFISIISKRNIITGRPVITADWKKKPFKATQQFVMDKIVTYFPLGMDYAKWRDDDLNLIEALMTFGGIGYAYSTKSPRELINTFKESISKAKTDKERAALMSKFRRQLATAYRTTFHEAYRNLADGM